MRVIVHFLKIYLLNLILVFSFMHSTIATANDIMPLPEASILPDVKIHTKTHPEKIIFAHIKLSGNQPDIDKFSKLSPKVEAAQDIDKSPMIISEYNRMANSFNLLDEKSEIVVHTSLKPDEYSSLQDIIVFDEFDEKTFFQYVMYDYAVGIVPEDIMKFSKLSLSKSSADRFFKLVNSESIVAEFILKPTFADANNPVAINNKSFFLMSVICRIAILKNVLKSKASNLPDSKLNVLEATLSNFANVPTAPNRQ
jgi:hypothetical protein